MGAPVAGGSLKKRKGSRADSRRRMIWNRWEGVKGAEGALELTDDVGEGGDGGAGGVDDVDDLARAGGAGGDEGGLVAGGLGGRRDPALVVLGRRGRAGGGDGRGLGDVRELGRVARRRDVGGGVSGHGLDRLGAGAGFSKLTRTGASGSGSAGRTVQTTKAEPRTAAAWRTMEKDQEVSRARSGMAAVYGRGARPRARGLAQAGAPVSLKVS